MKNTTYLIIIAAIYVSCGVLGQEVVDKTPPSPPVVQPPAPSPVWEVRLTSGQRAAIRDMVLPALAQGSPIKMITATMSGEGADRKARVTITAEIGSEHLAAIRGAIAPLWDLPAEVESRPIRGIRAAVTNDGSAIVSLVYE